jgi:hypothetical protein
MLSGGDDRLLYIHLETAMSEPEMKALIDRLIGFLSLERVAVKAKTARFLAKNASVSSQTL